MIYIAQYIMTGINVELPDGKIPGSLPVYLRANFTYPNGMRPIVYARMKLNETERLSVGCLYEAQDRESNINTICRKWWTSVVINRNFDHEATYRNISDTVKQLLLNNKCADYKVIPDSNSEDVHAQENKVDVEDPDVAAASQNSADQNEGRKKGDGTSGSNGSQSNSNGSGGGSGGSMKNPFGLGSSGLSGLNKYMKKASGIFCFTQLHVILNRRFHDKIGDYSYSGCSDPTMPVSNSTKPVVEQPGISLAQTDLGRLAVHSVSSHLFNDQQSFSPLL